MPTKPTNSRAPKAAKSAKAKPAKKPAKIAKPRSAKKPAAKVAKKPAPRAKKLAGPTKHELDTAARVDRFLAGYPDGPGPGTIFVGLKLEAIGGSVAAQMKQLGVGVAPEAAAAIMADFNRELSGVELDIDVLFGRLLGAAKLHLTLDQQRSWVLAMLQIDAERDGLVGDLGKGLFEALLGEDAQTSVVDALSESHGTVIHEGAVPEFLEVAGLRLADGRVVALNGPTLAQA